MERGLLAAISALPLVCGCASTLGTVFNRPVVENSVGGVVSTISLAAERRNVMVVTSGPNAGKYCAEPPPDTAKELATQLRAAVEAQAKAGDKTTIARGSLDDRLQEQITVLAARTPALDAFRIGLYSLCQLYVIGGLTGDQINTLFGSLVNKYPWTADSQPRTASSKPEPPAGPAKQASSQAPVEPAKPASPQSPEKPTKAAAPEPPAPAEEVTPPSPSAPPAETDPTSDTAPKTK